MQFIKENGALIGPDETLINLFPGNPGSVDFPDETMLKIHKKSPGYIRRFTHTHPPGMNIPSSADHVMMNNLAFVFYPFPVLLGIITLEDDGNFYEYVYQWILEPKEIWEVTKQSLPRNILVFNVSSRMIENKSFWEEIIIAESYK